MMSVTCPLLLCLLSALVEVHSQTIPYVSFMGTNLPNHSYVNLTLVGNAGNGSDNVQCRTDLNTCCSGTQGPDRGDWYYPNGNRLQYSGDIYENRGAQRVDLRRRNNGDTSGIYRCNIATNAVHDYRYYYRNTGGEVVYVGLYATGGDVSIPGGMNFTVGSDLNGESPQFTLTCTSTGGPATTVTWTRDFETVSGGMTALDDPVTAQYTHTLNVTGGQGGHYQCNVSNDKPSNATAELTVETDPLMVSLSPSTSSPMAGESVFLNCSVNLPGTVSGSPVFQWVGPGDIPMPASPLTSGQVVTSTLTLSAVRASQAGQYFCNASMENTTLTNSSTVNIAVLISTPTMVSMDIIVQIPAPTVSIMTSHSFPLYAGTSFSLTCNYTLSPSVDTSPATAVSWRVNDTTVDTFPNRITASEDSLRFSPLATSDRGSYTCEVNVTAQEYTTVEGPGQSAAVEVTVEALPSPEVTTTMDSTVTAGGQQALECTVSVVSSLTVAPAVRWVAPGNSEVASGSGPSLTHTLDPLRTSHAGQYTCRATVDIPSAGVSVSGHSSTTLTVQIPQPSVAISANHTAPFYTGTGLALTCTVSLDSSVDTDVHVSITWTGPRTIPGERYTVMEATGSGGTYTGSLTISPLAEGQDDGQYTCNVTVSGGGSVLEATSRDSTSIRVIGFIYASVDGATQSTSLTISWTAANGTTVTSYSISYSNRDTQCFTDSHTVSGIAAGETRHTLSDLEEGTEYTITVTALLTDGNTDADSVTATTLAAAPSAPPTSVSTFRVTSSRITVQWGAVDCIHHNGNITSYSVRYGVQGSGTTQTVSVSGGATTEATITGLESATNYELEVAAVNSAAIGVYSSPLIVGTSKEEVLQRDNTAVIVGGVTAMVVSVTIAVMIIVVVALLRFRCGSSRMQEPISSVDVPTTTNEAYELVKQTGEGGKGGRGRGGGGARGRGGEEGYEYEVVSTHPPAQPVAAGEGVYDNM